MTTTTTPALWDHQRRAVEFAVERKAALWHMGLGTGKSRCAISLAHHVGARRTLILCPLSVCEAWAEQYARFGDDDTEVVILSRCKGTVRRKQDAATQALARATAHARPLVVVVNYESARNQPLAAWLEAQRFDLLVLDEVHRIKSPAGTTSRWVSRLAKTCARRVGLTGTPMPHSPLDVYAQFRSLDPGIFGWSFVKFRRQYAVMGGWGGKQVTGFRNLDHLRERMARVTYQVDRSVLDLPEAIHERRVVDLSAKARRIYRDLDTRFAAEVQGGEITASNALVKLLRLQQLTSGVATIDDDPPRVEQIDTAKEDALVDLFEDLPSDEPVIVFGRFLGDMGAVHRAADRTGRESLELSGARRELQAWQAGAAPILAVQIQAGGVGIDLTRAAYCVYLSTGFSLGDYEQSLARCHRPGQKRSVAYYHIVARDTVDEQVYHALRERKNVVEAILDGIHERGA